MVLGPTGSIGTVEIHDGRTTHPAHLTTPGRIELASVLAAMVEVEADADDPRGLQPGTRPGPGAGPRLQAVGVFTNLSGDHLDYHGSMEAYELAKATLFESLSSTAFAISNLDDPGRRMLERTDARTIGITADPDRSIDGLDGGIVVARFGGRRWDATPSGRHRSMSGSIVRVPLVGDHNAFNVAAAVAIVRCLGGEPDAIESSLAASLETPAGRLEPVHGSDDDVAVFVDYAHSDDALRNVLHATRSIVRPVGRCGSSSGRGATGIARSDLG